MTSYYQSLWSLCLKSFRAHVLSASPADVAEGPSERAVKKIRPLSLQALPQDQQVKLAGASGAGWLYLTARPGVVAGALDAYIAAPLQYFFDSIRGRKRYKRTDFVLGNRIGEGSFGTVYEGALVGGKLDMDDEVGARGVRLNELEEGKYKKVVLKKVKIGVEGAEECGQMEDWFNRRMQRYAPDMCAEYLGSFIADKTKGQFYKGGLWLVWNYQVGYPVGQGAFPYGSETKEGCFFCCLRLGPERAQSAHYRTASREQKQLTAGKNCLQRLFQGPVERGFIVEQTLWTMQLPSGAFESFKVSLYCFQGFAELVQSSIVGTIRGHLYSQNLHLLGEYFLSWLAAFRSYFVHLPERRTTSS
jgi:hypothetical protein